MACFKSLFFVVKNVGRQEWVQVVNKKELYSNRCATLVVGQSLLIVSDKQTVRIDHAYDSEKKSVTVIANLNRETLFEFALALTKDQKVILTGGTGRGKARKEARILDLNEPDAGW